MKNIRIRYVFLLLTLFPLLFYSCQDSDEHLVQPRNKKYKVSLSDSKLAQLISETRSLSNSNGRIADIQYREDSALVMESENIIKYSIPIVSSISGASENLVLDSDETGLQSAKVYSLQPDYQWIVENYEGQGTDFSTFEGNLGITDIVSGETAYYSNKINPNSRDYPECKYFISHYYDSEGTFNYWIWVDISTCETPGGGSNSGSNSGTSNSGTTGSDGGGDGNSSSSDGGGGTNNGNTNDGNNDDDDDSDPTPIPILLEPYEPCREGFVRNNKGVCVPDCPFGYNTDRYGNCIIICPEGERSDGNGACIPIEPCDTGDDILDNSTIQSDMNSILWTGSNASDSSIPMGDRSEQGGWVVDTGNGYDIVFFPPTWSRDACGLNTSSTWENEIPDNIVGIIHSHPYYAGEDRQSVCLNTDGTEVEEAYAGGPSYEDHLFLLAVANTTGDFNIKGYVVDGTYITSYDYAGSAGIITYNRCGY